MRHNFIFAIIIGLAAAGFRPIDRTDQNNMSDPTRPGTVLQQEEGDIGFEWAFGVISKKGKTLVPISITRDTVLKSGDEIKMMVKLTRDCFVYVIYYDSQGEISLLFPYSMGQLQTDYKMNKTYYIPKGRSWMALDTVTGKEKFFLIASTERLSELEIKLGDYFSAEPSTRKPLADQVVTEIRDLRKRYTTFATLAEKPLTIGGNIRSTDTVKVEHRPDVADIAVQIEARNFYSKTLTIDHR
jgi:hypothetical protein